MRLAFQEAVPAREPLPTWRSYEVDEACCAAYCELYGSKYVSGVKRGELWKSRREPDELWRCSIDRLPDAAFEGDLALHIKTQGPPKIIFIGPQETYERVAPMFGWHPS